jgi:hypothetical protein
MKMKTSFMKVRKNGYHTKHASKAKKDVQKAMSVLMITPFGKVTKVSTNFDAMLVELERRSMEGQIKSQNITSPHGATGQEED